MTLLASEPQLTTHSFTATERISTAVAVWILQRELMPAPVRRALWDSRGSADGTSSVTGCLCVWDWIHHFACSLTADIRRPGAERHYGFDRWCVDATREPSHWARHDLIEAGTRSCLTTDERIPA